MAVTQYIGARYVPLFYTASDNTNSWESGVQYEALTVVTYLNQSYTSKIPVPASVGNPADNPTYWILTGAYNAQISQLTTDVDNLEDRVDDLETDMDLENEYILFIADSYGVSSGGVVAFPDLLDSYGIRDYVKDYDVMALAGAGFSQEPGQDSFADLSAAYSGDLISKITRIIVVGGTNDAKLARTTTATTGIDTLAAAAILKYPKLRSIDILYCSHVKLGNYSTPNIRATWTAYNAYSSPIVHLYNAVNCFDWDALQADGMHPTTYGQQQLTRAIISFIAGKGLTYSTKTVIVSATADDATYTCYASLKPIGENVEHYVQLMFTNSPNTDWSCSLIGTSETMVLGNAAIFDIGDNALHTVWYQQARNGHVLLGAVDPAFTGRRKGSIVNRTVYTAAEVGYY